MALTEDPSQFNRDRQPIRGETSEAPLVVTGRTRRQSDHIGKLAEALALAQGKIKGALKDSANPFFKSKYSDLASVREACYAALSAHGIAMIQIPRSTDEGVEVETLMAHSSGEWISDTLALPVAKHDAQGIGSALTYARRYSLAAFAGVAPVGEDDDGNAAVAAQGKVVDLRKETLTKLQDAAKLGIPALESAWKALAPDARAVCTKDLAGLKASVK